MPTTRCMPGAFLTLSSRGDAMGNLLAYSGITAKVKAMESQFLTDGEFREMAALESVPEAVDFLKQRFSYGDLFTSLDEGVLHRGFIEKQLMQSQYRDYSKLYRFASMKQRRFLNLYFMHYEIEILKKCLRNVFSHTQSDLGLAVFQDFFQRHSSIDLIRLSTSETLDEFLTNLKGSMYYEPLMKLENMEAPTLFDYEMCLDLHYYKFIWKAKDKFLTAQEQKSIASCFGQKMDLLNLLWIYRSKKYFRMSPADIYAMLIPVEYRLTREELTKMTESASLEEMLAAVQGTYYARFENIEALQSMNIEAVYDHLMYHIHAKTSRQEPYSVAILNSYLFFKELEVHRIITVIEGIRYGLGQPEITRLVGCGEA